ncbi:MAG: VanZ family protein [Eubacterium sp.]|nr:VanZ family protein [Eubacterium sp.]MCC8173959.1 VanZ family protein [Odoribacter sp.]
MSDRWPKAISIIVPTFLLGAFSFIIEVIQLSFNLGLAEMDDILHNTIGALLGTIIAMAIMTLLNGHKTEKTK